MHQLPKWDYFANFLPKTAWKWKNLDPQGGASGKSQIRHCNGVNTTKTVVPKLNSYIKPKGAITDKRCSPLPLSLIWWLLSLTHDDNLKIVQHSTEIDLLISRFSSGTEAKWALCCDNIRKAIVYLHSQPPFILLLYEGSCSFSNSGTEQQIILLKCIYYQTRKGFQSKANRPLVNV